ncbi:MAG: J domain-containing protein [bacterium]|nr:J domain-containing protein [bacterium]
MGHEDFNFFYGYAFAGKQWGWFWGLWDALWERDTHPPLISGFVPTKAAAQAQTRNLVAYPTLLREGRLKGIHRFIAHHEAVNRYARSYIENPLWPAYANPVEPTRFAFVQNPMAPVYSLLELAPREWVWYLWESIFDFLADHEPVQQGRAPIEREAAQLGLDAAGGNPGQGLPFEFAAQHYQRSLDRAGGVALDPKDFVYGNASPYFALAQQEWSAYQIVGRSAKNLFVYRKPFPFLFEGPRDPAALSGEVYAVDRITLEAKGSVYCRAFGGYFSDHRDPAQPLAPKSPDPTPQVPLKPSWELIQQLNIAQARRFLGLTPPYEASDLKSAFRALVFACHPDHGGDNLKFMLLERAFVLVQAELEAAQGRVSA